MSTYERLVEALKQYHSPKWTNQYFDLQKKLLIELQIGNEDPRLALSLRTDKAMPLNLGQRYVLHAMPGEYVRCIVPAAFEEKTVKARFLGYFSPKTRRDAKWLEVHYPEGSTFPLALYNACTEACMDILRRSKKSSFRKHHVPLLYDFTIEKSVREEVLEELTQA